MQRLTETDKWKDVWFLSLTTEEKLTYNFLCDNCDEGGFYEINFQLMNHCLKLDETQVRNVLNKLRKTFAVNGDYKVKPSKLTTKIWLNKFLFHQNRLPLDLSDANSRRIHFLIESHLEDFKRPKEMLQILETAIGLSVKKAKKKTTPKEAFVAPDFNKFREYYLSLGETDEDEIANVYDHYVSCGWKVGNKPMVDWNAAVNNCYRKKLKEKNLPAKSGNTGGKESRIETLAKESEKYLNKINNKENKT